MKLKYVCLVIYAVDQKIRNSRKVPTKSANKTVPQNFVQQYAQLHSESDSFIANF